MDKSCSNESRLYYLPSCPVGEESETFAWAQEGKAIKAELWADPPVDFQVKAAREFVPDPDAEYGIPTPEYLLLQALERAEWDGRNNTAFWLTCQLRDNRYPQEKAEGIAREFANRIFTTSRDPFTEEEALRCVDSGYKGEPREPWRKSKKYRIRVDSTADKNDEKGRKGVFDVFVSDPDEVSITFSTAPRSLSVELLPVPVLESSLLPPTLRDWVFDAAERVGCPPEFVATPAIISLGSVLGRKIGIRPKQLDAWVVVANLWGAVVGRPGALKTPGTSEALKPIQQLEAQAREAHKELMQEWEIDALLRKTEAEKAKDELKRGKALDEGKKRELAARALDTEMEEEPTCRRFVVNDVTLEKLGELLKENPNGLLQYRDELMGFFRTLERQGRESDRAFFLEAWNGTGSFVYDRIGRGTVFLPAMCVSLFGTIQPGPLASFLRHAVTGESSDGFVSRLQLLVWPDSIRYRHVDRSPNKTARHRVSELFDRLDALTPESVGAVVEEGELPYLRFDPDAQNFFNAWRERLEERLTSDEETPLFIEHLSKYRSLLPSLALLFHLSENTGPVSLAAIHLASQWCDFLEAHARRVYQCVADGGSDLAERLGGRVKASLPNPFTQRDVVRKGWAGLSRPDEIDNAIGILEDRGWVKRVEVQSLGEDGKPQGRPTEKFYIHPVLITDKNVKNPQISGEVEL
ncbi:DUF3987 domain-containing protein [Armatimonas sp.]|uniref:DUF3987 domain-containing protein n=1 Tax=Armatimonas sp. TaxID=1872638 RepID=UPI00286B43F3|nr:DUF3987 domain-containing protein [Armatimonas sp.]